MTFSRRYPHSHVRLPIKLRPRLFRDCRFNPRGTGPRIVLGVPLWRRVNVTIRWLGVDARFTMPSLRRWKSAFPKAGTEVFE